MTVGASSALQRLESDTFRRAIPPGPVESQSGILNLFVRSAAMILAERRSIRTVLRFLVQALCHPAATARLLRFFRDDAEHVFPRPVRVDALLKLGRRHVRRGLTGLERADLLIAHHTALRRLMRPDMLADFLADRPIHLASMDGRDGLDTYAVWLVRAPFGYQEGDAMVSLNARVGGQLTDLSFSLCGADHGSLCLRIGGVQGPPPPHGRTAIKAATKALDGLRPKAAAVEVIYQLARDLGATCLLATAYSHHAFSGTRKGAGTYPGAYAYWEEIGGVLQADGDYLLPPRPPHRLADEVPARRRREWDRRQQRIAALTADVARTVASLGCSQGPCKPTV